MTRWEYARLEYRATGTFGADAHVDWSATFHHPDGPQHWGVDERFGPTLILDQTNAGGDRVLVWSQ